MLVMVGITSKVFCYKKKKYLLILLCVVIMLFNELARQASECFAFLSSGVRPRNVAVREFCIFGRLDEFERTICSIRI